MDRAEAATLRPFASALLLSYSPKCVEKLFGKSGWVPNRGSESGQEGSKESRSAISLAARSTAETPLAIFQTVSLRASVNKASSGGCAQCGGIIMRVPGPLSQPRAFGLTRPPQSEGPGFGG